MTTTMESHHLPHWGTPAGPMTPPQTDTVEPRRLWVPATRRTTTYSVQLLTPPDDDEAIPHPQPSSSRAKADFPSDTTYPPPSSHHLAPTSVPDFESDEEEMSCDEQPPAESKPDSKETETDAWARDWLHVARTRPESSALVAEKTCEMICYLWFAPTSSKRPSSPSLSSPTSPTSSTPSPSPLQLLPSPPFVAFTQKLLETTQLSQSAIVLALHFIHRLRQRNRGIPAQAGSEFRVCVAGLMMANKFLDDNTYTNATWASVSSIPLAQINTMEREFLAGCDYALYVSRKVYEDWGRLLRGLVGARARERERERGRRHAMHHRGGRLHPQHPTHSLYSAPRRPAMSANSSTTSYSSWVYATPSRAHSNLRVKRDRSSSPSPSAPLYSQRRGSEDNATSSDFDNDDRGRSRARSQERVDECVDERLEREREMEVGSKRRAEAAFSPPSYHSRPHHPGFATVYNTPLTNTHSQRPAPTLVIPTPTPTSTSFTYASSAGANHWSPVEATSTSTSSSASASSGHSFPLPLPKATSTTNVSLVTPLERFGAMSLSTNANPISRSVSRHPTPSPPRRRLRERPVSYAGATTASSAGLTAFAERYGGFQASPVVAERGRERSNQWGVSSIERATTSSPGTSPFVSTSAYVAPSPSTTVQYPPREVQHSLPSISTGYGQHEPQPQYPSTLAARWDYSDGAKAPTAQDLYFYTLTCSPMSDASSSSGYSPVDNDPSDDDSAMSDDGREAYRQQPTAVARGHPQAISDLRDRVRDPERYREEARRARLRYAPAPISTTTSTVSSWLPLPSAPQPQHPFAGSALINRWGVQSARTSPVRGPVAVPMRAEPTEWTPPRATYAEVSAGGGGWTPPRVALPHFADLEKWSGQHRLLQSQSQTRPTTTAQSQYQPPPSLPPPESRKTHQPQPRRAVFANAGPPGVSGYAYAY
ncbi:hypothetical protein MIND_00414000 [Mycena indigotica]|uniref:Cyclin n=1 Tax=Mycena indigotica TaxID=2126181 RepID=A0A8H6WBC2_9AGAR|nr:uncharacterized protein MIND_00414000 [Mycena indigotica]KAF7306234.1 hypothetical protein MIND_00414000 [Mycena indigotica]